ncbi:MAG: hypothetical protein NTU91_12145 [Chloroflexi bacterium]|nr:hypothetical protein [Chloroflexota bacterium]
MGDASNPAPAAGTSSDGWVRTVLRRLSGDHLLVLALVLLAAGLFLNQAEFVPNLRDLNMWDEAAWIQSGRAILAGWLPTVGSSPLVSILYALTCLPFLDSPFWLVHSASLARLILYGLLWLCAYRIARRLPTPAAAILLGMTFVSPLFTSLFRYPSDPLYSALAGLSLAEVLAFHANHNLRHAWGSSALVGLAALARNDGVLLALVLVPLLLLLAPKGRRWRALVASVLPPVALIGGVILISGLQSGTFTLGTFERTYSNFEDGQQAVYEGTGERNRVVEARLEARRLFGTPEENHYSVWNAIRRNPVAYLARVRAFSIGLPSVFLEAYGKRFAAAFVVFAAAGFLTLVRRREYKLPVALVAFALPFLSVFVITIIRLSYPRLWWFSVYALAAIGLSELVGALGQWPRVAVWSAVWGAVAVYGVADNKLAIYYTAAVMLTALWIGIILARRERASAAAILLAVFLPAGLILHGSFPSPKIRQLGVAGDEQALLYLRDHFPPGTLVATGIPGVVQAAGMNPATLSSTDVPQFDDPAEVVRWMRVQDMQVVYVDAGLYRDNPALWSLIEAEIGSGFQRVFVAEEGNYQVLLVTPP